MNREINDAYREILQGYYIKIFMDKPTVEEILNLLQADINTVRMNDLLMDAEEIIANYYPHEVSEVQCEVCNHTWVSVRPKGLMRLECPNCHNMSFFKNIQ